MNCAMFATSLLKNPIGKISIFRVFLLMLVTNIAAAQATDEIWPELDLFYRVNDKFRVYLLASATQLKESSSYTDGRTGIHVDYLAFPFLRTADSSRRRRGDYLWFRLGYNYASSTPNVEEDVFKDHIIVTEVNARFYLPGKFVLTGKNRFDWKIPNSSDLEVRYRPRITVEHGLKTQYMTLTPYFYVEYFLNFGHNNVDRLRICGGAEFRVTKIMNTEIYFLHQFPNGDVIPTLDALGLAFKFYLPLRERSLIGNRKRNLPEVTTETNR